MTDPKLRIRGYGFSEHHVIMRDGNTYYAMGWKRPLIFRKWRACRLARRLWGERHVWEQ